MSETLEHHPSERELALSAHQRRKAFHRSIEAKAAELRHPADIICQGATWESVAPPVAVLPAADWFKECWFLIEGASPCRTLSMTQIKQAVCAYYGVALADMLSARRTKDIILPRFVAVYLCKELTPSTLPAIGRAFGGRDHTTVLSAIRKITRLRGTDAKLAAAVAEIRTRLEALL